MVYKKQIPALDLETTAIENIFLTEVLPMAGEIALKVYLLGYRYACEPEIHARFSHEALARHLGISLQEVLTAWDYWAERGLVIKAPGKGERQEDFTIEFVSLRQLYVENNFRPRHEATPRPKATSPEQLFESLKEPELKKMFGQVEKLMGRPLEANDCMEILNWLEALPVEPKDIIRAFEFVVKEKNIKNIKYTGTVVRSWCDKNTDNPSSASAKQEKLKPAAPKAIRPNRFHNFEGQLSKLSEAELDQLIQKKKSLRKSPGGEQ